MDIRIIHTADNHIGKKFNGRYSPSAQERLVNERFEALQRVVDAGNQRHAHFLVVAGDLFDTINVTIKDIKRTISILKTFQGEEVLVLPGNHDFYEQGEKNLWNIFTDLAGDAITVLHQCKQVEYNSGEQKVVFYPGPCNSKHSAVNAIGWIKDEKIDKSALNIGIAHGNVDGLGLGGDKYFNMTPAELKSGLMDCWLLGHIHAPYPEKASLTNPGFLFSATHTPDGFDNKRDGFCWFLEFGKNKNLKMEQVITGAVKFYEWNKIINSVDDVENLCREIDVMTHGNSLLKLILSGRISENEMKLTNDKLIAFNKLFLHFECENNLLLQIDKAFINSHYPDNSLPHQLLMELAADEEDNLALQLAHQIIEEAKV
ncbi:MAG: metallophosphoesterase family protein [Bacteroidia bacterium]